ncbi:MAG: glycosyltransferase family 2 protein [Deltaproteobacteria bacterium]|nr:glycosyltransferase family 2 protein [Deltaproteobacteria bacterium]
MPDMPLLLLRVAGVVVGLAGLWLTYRLRFRARRLANSEWLLGTLLAFALVVCGLVPNAFDFLLGLFAFRKGGGQRLIGLLIFSNLLSYVLIYLALTRSNRAEEVIDRVVRELAKRQYRESRDADDAQLYIVIPAFNEAANIGAVLAGVPPLVCGLRTKPIVVVDGATDDTATVVRQCSSEPVCYLVNRGGGSALKAGYDLAIENGGDIVVTLDADGQHRPDEISRLVQPIVDGRADLVNGSRLLGRYQVERWSRATGLVLFNWLISLLTLTRITDCSSGFRAIRTAELAKLELRQPQFHTSELLIEALRKGLRVTEVPISGERRRSGESKKPASWRYGWGFARAIVSTWLR